MTGTGGGALPVVELVEQGATLREADWTARYESVTPEDICTFIYTSGTTGPPKGCVISHGNYRAMLDMVVAKNVLGGGDELTYLFLPLAHSFALLISSGRSSSARRSPVGARPAADHGQPDRGQADLLPVGAQDLREDLRPPPPRSRRKAG